MSETVTLQDIWTQQEITTAIDAASVALWRWDVDSNNFKMDAQGFSLWGLPWSDELQFEHLSAQIHPADRDRVRAAFIATRSVSGAYEQDFRIIVKDDVKWVSSRGRGADEGIVGRAMYGIFLDVTGRKQAEEGHELLAGEMSHRVQNLLAIASGLTALTSRSAETVAEMTRDLTRRLTALGRAHNLVRPLPASQGTAALLGDVITVLLAPYDDLGAFSGRIRVAVPRMGVGEHGATILAMVIHELATNSVKHGALSSDYGMLDITGVIRQDKLELTWAETGGPVVGEPPVLNGFGSKMLVNIIKSDLKGSITYSWYPSGLVAQINADLNALAT